MLQNMVSPSVMLLTGTFLTSVYVTPPPQSIEHVLISYQFQYQPIATKEKSYAAVVKLAITK